MSQFDRTEILRDKVFDSWHISRKLGQGGFGKVYEIEKEEPLLGTVRHDAMKVLSVPGGDADIRDIVNEIVLLEKFKGNSNIVSYEDHVVHPHEEDDGFDILIRMELLKPLTELMKERTITERDVIRIGIDLCKALELCHREKIIHRDIKPENIFVSASGDYKLGDFGVARILDNTLAMTRVGALPYIAPEIYKGESYGVSADLYSLGIVLYRLVNRDCLPFMTKPLGECSSSEREDAFRCRIKGMPLPAPCEAEDQLVEVILKACANEPKDRFASAAEMKIALEKLERSSMGTGCSADFSHESHRKLSKWILPITVVLIIVLATAGGFWFAGQRDNKTDNNRSSTNVSAASHVFAHRGAGGAEETFAGYDNAIAQGAQYIEQDVILAEDWELYVSHDPRSYEELKEEKKLKLKEVFERYRDSVSYVIEIKSKDQATEEVLVDLIKEYGYEDRVIIQCFELWVLKAVKHDLPEVKTLYLCSAKHGGQEGFENALGEDYVDIISVSIDDGMMTKKNCRKVHKAGKEFSAWVLNQKSSIIKAIEMDVDNYFSDKPARAIKLEKKYRE